MTKKKKPTKATRKTTTKRPRKTKAKKAKIKLCPPAIAKGVKTTAKVKPIKRPRGQGPRKLIRKGPKLKKRQRKTSKRVGLDLATDDKPKEPFVHQRWTTYSRRILNEKKDRMARRKRLSTSTKKRLGAADKRKLKRLRRRLHNLFNNDITHD